MIFDLSMFIVVLFFFFFFSSRRRHTRLVSDWSSDVCSSDLTIDFNLMFKTIVGALGGEEDAAYLRPETAQGIFVNFKNVRSEERRVGKECRSRWSPYH